MSKILLYHYTDQAGAAGIEKYHVIQGSTEATPTRKRRFGKGVYFTSISPDNHPREILLNNYDDAGHVINSKRLWARVEWVVEVYLDIDDVEKVDECNRDVYLYPGDVRLDRYQCRIYPNPRM